MLIYRITGAAAKVGLHPATLRDYEKKGLIHFQRDSVGHRVLFDADLVKIRQIYASRVLGLPTPQTEPEEAA